MTACNCTFPLNVQPHGLAVGELPRCGRCGGTYPIESAPTFDQIQRAAQIIADAHQHIGAVQSFTGTLKPDGTFELMIATTDDRGAVLIAPDGYDFDYVNREGLQPGESRRMTGGYVARSYAESGPTYYAETLDAYGGPVTLSPDRFETFAQAAAWLAVNAEKRS